MNTSRIFREGPIPNRTEVSLVHPMSPESPVTTDASTLCIITSNYEIIWNKAYHLIMIIKTNIAVQRYIPRHKSPKISNLICPSTPLQLFFQMQYTIDPSSFCISSGWRLFSQLLKDYNTDTNSCKFVRSPVSDHCVIWHTNAPGLEILDKKMIICDKVDNVIYGKKLELSAFSREIV